MADRTFQGIISRQGSDGKYRNRRSLGRAANETLFGVTFLVSDGHTCVGPESQDQN